MRVRVECKGRRYYTWIGEERKRYAAIRELKGRMYGDTQSHQATLKLIIGTHLLGAPFSSRHR